MNNLNDVGMWLWITNCVILLEAEVDAEVERGHQIQARCGPSIAGRSSRCADTWTLKNQSQ